MLNRSLLLVILMLTAACGTGIKPEQIARVEQNFNKIKQGMTKEEVEKLIGKPYRYGTITHNVADSLSDTFKPALE
jgi:outer membrane protein assembly factor BamE (lipoprotein component of BamABCDE complex)